MMIHNASLHKLPRSCTLPVPMQVRGRQQHGMHEKSVAYSNSQEYIEVRKEASAAGGYTKSQEIKPSPVQASSLV
eukprot:1158467-Pelagomonas_calceolata.AAC.5